MNVSYSCNNGYIPQTGISMISLFENNKNLDKINIFFISKDVSPENKLILKNICAKYGRNLVIYELRDLAYDLKLTSTGRHIETIYAKIFFSRINGLEKVLYIDSDTIINGSLSEFYNSDLTSYYMGMIETYTGEKAKSQLGMDKESSFFNDGVALVNVDYCRKNELINKCISVIKEFNGNPPILSEGVLNKVCEGHIKSLSPKYNMMAGLYQLISLNPEYVSKKTHYSINELKESFTNPIIIHYLSGFYDRPWNRGCTHPLNDVYLKYKSISPWKDMPLKKGTLSLRLRLLGILLNLIGPNKFDKIRKIIKS